ncbi:TPA: hypothetical protein ACS28R_004337, partial [Klebsiella aerogenes]
PVGSFSPLLSQRGRGKGDAAPVGSFSQREREKVDTAPVGSLSQREWDKGDTTLGRFPLPAGERVRVRGGLLAF